MKKLVLLATALLVALSALPATAQLDPRTRPKKRGPLAQDNSVYPGRPCKKGKFRDGGEVTSRYAFCTYFYSYDPARDNNAERDYGAIWLQTRVNPENRWCADRVKTRLGIDITGSGSVHNRAPGRKRIRTKRPRDIATRLIVDANGRGSGKGVLRASWTIRRKGVTIRRSTSGGFRNVQVNWRGRTRKALAFVAGFEISWPQGGAPPDVFPQLRARHVKPCR